MLRLQCDQRAKWADTASKFKGETTMILPNSQHTYKHLVRESEDLVLKTFSSISHLAGQIGKAGEKLHNSFDEAQSSVEALHIAIEGLKNTYRNHDAGVIFKCKSTAKHSVTTH